MKRRPTCEHGPLSVGPSPSVPIRDGGSRSSNRDSSRPCRTAVGSELPTSACRKPDRQTPTRCGLANLTAGNCRGVRRPRDDDEGSDVALQRQGSCCRRRGWLGAGRSLDGAGDRRRDSCRRVDVGRRILELHAYLAVAGGLNGPELFGSCSSDLLSGLGAGPRAPATHSAWVSRVTLAVRADDTELDSRTPRARAPVPGDEILEELTSTTFKVSPDSNRIGVRLIGSPPLITNGPEPIDDPEPRTAGGRARHASYGMVPGALQIPPSGEPVVLLCDHTTMGGYPVVATVITADIGVVAQRRPGDAVQFEFVDLDEAMRALEALDRQIANAPTGIYPTGPVT